MEQRKIKEVEWSDFRRTINEDDKEKIEKYTSNLKFYSITRSSTAFINNWIKNNCKEQDVFEIGCGDGCHSFEVSKVAKTATAADIAPVSIQLAIEKSKDHPIYKKIKYLVLDCENTGLPKESFDVICESGSLHHMDLNAAYSEAARLLRPNGKFLCVEALRHNPIIHMYRKKTPHLRTEWEVEHILGKKEIMLGLKYFTNMEVHFFHLTAIIAVPFRNTFLFNPILSIMDAIDSIILKIPGFRWLAWQAVFIFKGPIKNTVDQEK